MRRSSPPARVRRFGAIALAVLLLVGAVAPAAAAAPGEARAAQPAAGTDAPPDPENDTIGWEDGIWHNESIEVNQSDGLTDAELETFVARSMARVEYVREAEFNGTVPVEIISRQDYRNRTAANASDRPEFNRWNDQVWESLFIVGEDTSSATALSETSGSSVAGFYSPADDQIKIITSTPESPTVSNATLIHELVHALQDQRYDLTNATYRARTQDGDLGVNGVVEGEANYVEARYSQRCGEEWDCVETPGGPAAGGGQPNLGVLLTIFNPYSDGPVYVSDVVEEGGWAAFDERFRNPPRSSEQIIHATDEEPQPIEFEDTARGGWETFPAQGENGSDTVGEASIYSMFWYQARQYGADTINPQTLFDTDGQYDVYNYDAPPSDGWANDRVFPYRNGEGEGAEYGYVWKTTWDTERDATEFHDAYLRMLEAHDVEETEEGYYVVPGGPFEDAFLVVQNGTEVVVVNGPSVDAVEEIRPTLSPDTGTATPTPTPTSATDEDTGAGTDEGSNDEMPRSTTETETTGAGFGFLVAVIAVGVAGLLARRD
ncbi:Hvo_1808 family surface protein [Halorarum halobium]|uniref:Hvo_1808 family surface protein n=1 Tax=Halorarum halobium TaxID=3075121 RepID=UPI0028AB8649|nr:Hvo_1808 family surface protein [Halobaculum sp. XH14]